MADVPHRLLVLQRLTQHLQAVYGHDQDGNPYDMTNSVVRGKLIIGANEPVPLISILEAPRPDIPVFGGQNEVYNERNWSIYLQGWAVDDPKNPTDPAHWLMAAVDERLGLIIRTKSGNGGGRPNGPIDPEAYLLGNLIANFTYGPGIVRPADQVSGKAFFYLPVQIGLVTTVGEPYRSA